MTEYDWMGGREIRPDLETTFREAAAARGIPVCHPSLVDRLVERMEVNWGYLAPLEMAKPPGSRRTRRDALAAAHLLAHQSAAFAAVAGRQSVEPGDLEKALRAWECMVWPFCRESETPPPRNPH